MNQLARRALLVIVLGGGSIMTVAWAQSPDAKKEPTPAMPVEPQADAEEDFVGGLFQHGARLPADCPTVAVRRPSRGDARNGERHLQFGRLATPGAPLDDAGRVPRGRAGRPDRRVAGLRRQRADPATDANASLAVRS